MLKTQHALIALFLLFPVLAQAETSIVISNPPALLWVNGKATKQTPTRLNLKPGKYRFQLRHWGYKRWTSWVIVPKNASLSLNVQLQPNKRRRRSRASSFGNLGLLLLKSSPEGAEVYINGFLRGKTPAVLKLKKGYHSIELRKEGYLTKQTTTRVGQKMATKLIQLQATQKTFAPSTNQPIVPKTPQVVQRPTQLMLFSRPFAKVYLNGTLVGNSPFLSAGLKPGTYQILLKRRGYYPYKRIVQLLPGKKVRLRAVLVPRR